MSGIIFGALFLVALAVAFIIPASRPIATRIFAVTVMIGTALLWVSITLVGILLGAGRRL